MKGPGLFLGGKGIFIYAEGVAHFSDPGDLSGRRHAALHLRAILVHIAVFPEAIC